MSQLNVNTIKNRTGTSGPVLTGLSTVSGSLVVSNDATVSGAATITGALTVGGVLTYEDVTNVDSVGVVTARLGVNVTGGEIAVGAAFSVGQAGIITATGGSFTGDVDIADKIVHTGDTNTAIRFPAADTFTVETGGSERLRVDSSGNVAIGTATAGGTLHVENSGELNAFFEGSASTLGARILLKNNNNTANAYNDIEGADAGGQGTSAIRFINVNDGNNEGELAIRTRPSGGSITERLRITSTGGVHFNNAELIERVKITSGKLSDNTNIDLDDGMVHYFTTTETSAAVPNITSSVGINTSMATGDTMSVTIVTTAAAAAFAGTFAIDHKQVGVTTFFSGGAPTEGGSSGKDVTALTIVKTGDAAFDVLASVTNFE